MGRVIAPQRVIVLPTMNLPPIIFPSNDMVKFFVGEQCRPCYENRSPIERRRLNRLPRLFQHYLSWGGLEGFVYGANCMFSGTFV